MKRDPNSEGQVARLFRELVPDVASGRVRIQGVARRVGDRAMVSVSSDSGEIDPIGVCVGVRGSVIREVSRRLDGERMDLIRWAGSAEELIRGALDASAAAGMTFYHASQRVEIVANNREGRSESLDSVRLELLSVLSGHAIRIS